MNASSLPAARPLGATSPASCTARVLSAWALSSDPPAAIGAIRVVHLYPFPPSGPHGGTMRLRGALAGTARAGELELYVFDPLAGAWKGFDPADVGTAQEAVAADAAAPAPAAGLKRRLFPSTLWEAGRRPLASVPELLRRVGPLRDAIVVLHTTFLAPAAAAIRSLGGTVLVDAYDLVWRSHANDATTARPGVRGLRRLYAAAV